MTSRHAMPSCHEPPSRRRRHFVAEMKAASRYFSPPALLFFASLMLLFRCRQPRHATPLRYAFRFFSQHEALLRVDDAVYVMEECAW